MGWMVLLVVREGARMNDFDKIRLVGDGIRSLLDVSGVELVCWRCLTGCMSW